MLFASWLVTGITIMGLGALGLILLPSAQEQRAGRLALATLGLALIIPIIGLLGQNGSPGAITLASNPKWHLDSLALPFVINTVIVSVVAFVYAQGEMHQLPRSALAYALMLIYVASLFATLVAADAIAFLISWEVTVIASSLLLLGWGQAENGPAITLKYFLYSQIGSLMIFAGLGRLASAAGSTDLGQLIMVGRTLPSGAIGIASLMLVGFAIKLGVFPLHTWRPDAYVSAPMPVTIILAGAAPGLAAYGALRLVLPLLSQVTPVLQISLLIVALCSQIYGAMLCLSADNLKRVLAYSSVSQMGYVLFGIVTLVPQGVAGSIMQLVNHGLYKTLLFVGVGIIGYGTGYYKTARLRNVGRLMPGIAIAMAIGAIGMTGWPPSAAFHSEWMIISGGLVSQQAWLGYLQVLAPLATTVYIGYYLIQLGTGPLEATLEETVTPATMRWPLYLLTGLVVVLGFFPAPILDLATKAATLATGGIPW